MTKPITSSLSQLIYVSIASFFLLIYSNLFVDAFGQLNRYWTALNGDQQIPPVDTDARGFVGLKFSDDYTQLIYNVNLHNIHNVTGIYLYYGNDTQNAKPVLDLLKKTKESNREDERASDITKDGHTTVVIGDVTDKIIEYSNNERIDLLVIGSVGLRGISGFFKRLGSVSRSVSERADNCPYYRFFMVHL